MNYFILCESYGKDGEYKSEVLCESIFANRKDAIRCAQSELDAMTSYKQWNTPIVHKEGNGKWKITFRGSSDDYCYYSVKSSQCTEKEILKKYTKYIAPKTARQTKQPNTNNQNTTSMANQKNFKPLPYDPNTKDKFGRVIGNPYRGTIAGKTYQAVPEQMISLPQGNSFIVARKHIVLDKNNNQATYVFGYNNLGTKNNRPKTQNGHVRRTYFVARLIWRGGSPALSLYRYVGYNQVIARQVFSEIPYDSAEYKAKDGKFYPYSKSSMTAKEIVEKSIRQQEYQKTKMYGDAAKRRTYVAAHPDKYPPRYK